MSDAFGGIVLAVYASLLVAFALSHNLPLLAGWYSVTNHLQTAAIDGANFRVSALTFAALGAVAALAFAVLPRLMGVVSATLSDAYGPMFAGVSLTASVLASAVAAPFAIGAGPLTAIVGFAPLLVVLFLMRLMERDRPGRFDDLAGRLFLFRITSGGRDDTVPVFEGEASKPKTYSEKIAAILLPVSVALAGLVTTTFALQFGSGLRSLLEPVFNGAELQPIFSTGRLTFAIVAIFLGLPFVRRARNLSRRIKAAILKIAFYAIALMFLIAVASMAAYALIAPAAAASPFIRGIGYVYFGLAVISSELLRFDVLWRENLDDLTTVRYALRSRKFWIDSHKILSQFPQPVDPKGYL
ncbi:MAG: hypothetical protein KDJ36_15085, partial [Hyphomicrobiaceae bacterium]|nr:hypothetical protein [Hyphomicrobiaceae bacterium]